MKKKSKNFQPKVCAIIAAAGRSSRMNLEDGISKQFIKIGGQTVIEKTAAVFDSCPYINDIIIAARQEDIEKIREIVANAGLHKVRYILSGGETRQQSVANAAEAVGDDIDFIAIHDGARCFISHADIEKVMLRAFKSGAAAAATKITDTVKFIGPNKNIVQTIDRDYLWTVQTPQIFRKELYLSALSACKNEVTDDCAIVENAGHGVSIVECSKYNIKITDTEDLDFFLKGL